MILVRKLWFLSSSDDELIQLTCNHENTSVKGFIILFFFFLKINSVIMPTYKHKETSFCFVASYPHYRRLSFATNQTPKNKKAFNKFFNLLAKMFFCCSSFLLYSLIFFATVASLISHSMTQVRKMKRKIFPELNYAFNNFVVCTSYELQRYFFSS